MSKALIIVDVQNDFCPGGALAVNDGDTIIPILNQLIPRFDIVVYTRDWHPSDHISFSKSPKFTDKSWPAHCVANTRGADFHPDLLFDLNAIVIDKATESEKEAYSGFEDTNLVSCLHKLKIESVYIAGLATDYCVKATVLDALKAGFTVYLINDACKGVNPESTTKALNEMQQAGAKIIISKEV